MAEEDSVDPTPFLGLIHPFSPCSFSPCLPHPLLCPCITQLLTHLL